MTGDMVVKDNRGMMQLTCPYKERASLTCNLATRLLAYLKGDRGQSSQGYVHWDMEGQSREKGVLVSG